ncbi:MAG: hypothetical protein NVV68_03045 [Dokdonella sp.]|nr:hypothetical protein [Dokdonella sp.]
MDVLRQPAVRIAARPDRLEPVASFGIRPRPAAQAAVPAQLGRPDDAFFRIDAAVVGLVRVDDHARARPAVRVAHDAAQLQRLAGLFRRAQPRDGRRRGRQAGQRDLAVLARQADDRNCGIAGRGCERRKQQGQGQQDRQADVHGVAP